MHRASYWSSAYLLKSRDAERTAYAQRKAGRGIRIETKRGVTVVARTVLTRAGVEALPIRAYDIARNARSWSAER